MQSNYSYNYSPIEVFDRHAISYGASAPLALLATLRHVDSYITLLIP